MEKLTYFSFDSTTEHIISKDDIVNFYNRVAKQTNYLGIYENEYTYCLKLDRDLMIVAYTTEIVGIVTVIIPEKRKNLHVGTLAIAIDNNYCGKGIGKELMSKSIEWYKKNNSLTRLQLFVRTDNKTAIALYKKFNFITEGELRNDTCIDGVYYNVYPMSILK